MLVAKNRHQTTNKRTKLGRQATSIDMLPDEVLLEIFDFCTDEDQLETKKIKACATWHSLVHVCRQWRSVVFGSPRRLKLQLVCTSRRPVGNTLEVWPALPLTIRCDYYKDYRTKGCVDNIVAVLERSDRVAKIGLSKLTSSALKRILAAMLRPFPELTDLRLKSCVKTEPILPDSFLGGSAPRLRILDLNHIILPDFPKLLLSATHLVDLTLWNISSSGYVSPEALVTCLSTLTRLETLSFGFRSSQSCRYQESRCLPPPTRTVLPALVHFWFNGDRKYLDDLVSRIDAPQLFHLTIFLFDQIVFDTEQFIQFISRTPALKALEKACVAIQRWFAGVYFSSRTPGHGELNVQTSCTDSDGQISSLEQICTSSLPPLSTLEDLYLYEARKAIRSTLWLELLRPFTTVKNLYLSNEMAPRITRALQVLVGDRTTEVLPTLQNIFIERLERLEQVRPVRKSTKKFVVARELSGLPISVSIWEKEFMVLLDD